MTEQSPPGSSTDQQPPTYEPYAGPRVDAAQMQDVARLRRSVTDRRVAGVAGGLGRHFDVDPTVIRVLLVVLSFFGGAGLLVYAVVWLLVPEDGADRAPVELPADVLKLALVTTLFVAVLITFGTPFVGRGWGLGLPVPLLVIGLAVAGIYSVARRRGQPASAPSVPSAPSEPGGTAAPPPAWMPPPVPAYVPPPRPRRSGAVLFWPTLALIAIALGVLGIVDVGHAVPVSAYAALALTVIGVMLLVGAFVGRPGGLIALGLVTTMVLGVTGALDATTGGTIRVQDLSLAPTSAAALRPDYQYGSGTLRIDLTGVQDLAALDGRTVDVHLDAGEIDVVVPRGLNVNVDATIRYVGQIDVGSYSDNGGWHRSLTRTLTTSTTAGTPTLDLRLDSRVGDINVYPAG